MVLEPMCTYCPMVGRLQWVKYGLGISPVDDSVILLEEAENMKDLFIEKCSE